VHKPHRIPSHRTVPRYTTCRSHRSKGSRAVIAHPCCNTQDASSWLSCTIARTPVATPSTSSRSRRKAIGLLMENDCRYALCYGWRCNLTCNQTARHFVQDRGPFVLCRAGRRVRRCGAMGWFEFKLTNCRREGGRTVVQRGIQSKLTAHVSACIFRRCGPECWCCGLDGMTALYEQTRSCCILIQQSSLPLQSVEEGGTQYYILTQCDNWVLLCLWLPSSRNGHATPPCSLLSCPHRG